MSTEQFEAAGSPAPVELDNVKPEEPNTPDAVTAADGEVDKQEQAKEERKFSQAELDAAIQKRLVKEQRRIERQLREQLESARTSVAPQRESFKDDEAYLNAQIEHAAELRAQQKLAERQKAEQAERMAEAFQERAEKAAERYADFQAVVSNPNLPINEGMAEFISESELGPDLAYYLGKNPSKAAEISRLSPIKAARELTRLEAELASKPKAQPSKAPEPINPVGSRSKASSSSTPSDDDDIATWMRKERERISRR